MPKNLGRICNAYKNDFFFHVSNKRSSTEYTYVTQAEKRDLGVKMDILSYNHIWYIGRLMYLIYQLDSQNTRYSSQKSYYYKILFRKRKN